MEHLLENTNYQKFKETIDDYITSNLTKETPVVMLCRQLQDNSILYTIGSGNIHETIQLLELTLIELKEYDNMKI